MGVVLKRELHAYRNSTIIWTSSIILLVIMFLSIYSSFASDVEASKSIISNLPPVLSDIIGLSLDNFFTIYGFMGYLLTFITLAGAVQAMNLGVGLLSKEESGKTADFLLTKPVARSSVFISKLLAGLYLLIVTNALFLATVFVMASAVEKNSFDGWLLLLISLKFGLIQLFFMAGGFLLSVILPKVKSVVSVSLPFVFGLFIVGTIGALLGLDSVKYVSPFKFFDNDYIISNASYDWLFLVINASFVLVAIIVSYIIFTKKDIRSGY
jgi:ABC-2 type transport system permease protein